MNTPTQTQSRRRGQIQIKNFLIFFAFVWAARLVYSYLTDDTVHRGPWYTVQVPPGWHKKVEGDEVSFSSPDEDIFTGMPRAIFSIYGKKSTGALFVDDLIIDVLESLSKLDGRVLDKGEIKIDGQIGKWVIFHNKDPPLVVLTFYIVDDFNRLTKIEYVTDPDHFKHYRPEFEKFKDGIKFKRLF